ncbi:hypothetical protein BSP38_094 [Bacillus phage BSP38]|uniref:Uncharacterized protein n=1 Tax=Bacillus phage BSP38 TaxID=2283013 RepID=A0A345MJV4_BPBSP|nr:virion structural protein [Bacillus phage BSP38]AXH71136.1 hypothetical protein BSP38_094 [Bacillus phage BSP38]
MPISDGKNTLRKIAFQHGTKFFRFAINPETYVFANPHRTTALKTKSRIVIEDFQNDVPTITIAGTTGFNPTGREADRGINKIKEMKQYLKAYGEMGGNGQTSEEDFYFHDFTNDESYVVHLGAEGVTYSQDVNSPLTHRYEIKFVVLRKASEPKDEDVVDPEIGNRFPSISDGTGDLSPDLFADDPLDPYDPSSGNPDVYNGGNSGVYIPPQDLEPINPQAPSPSAYGYGMSGLGYAIGYYARRVSL